MDIPCTIFYGFPLIELDNTCTTMKGCIISKKGIIILFDLADGIFDNLSNKEIIKIIWKCLYNYNKNGMNKKEITKKICNEIINKSIEKGSTDNLSLIFICFDNFFNNNENIDQIIKRVTYQNCDSMII